MRKRRTAGGGFFKVRVLFAVLVCATAACSMVSGALLDFFRPETSLKLSQRTLTFQERVAYQRAIEEVYWRHRIWPKENPDPKPSLDAVMSQARLEKKVEDYLRDSRALEDYRHEAITAEQLQAEIDRMARNTKQPEVLRELFEALGNDASVIAECLARPVLAERLVADLSTQDKRQRFALLRTKVAGDRFNITTLAKASYTLPEIDPCSDDTWTPTSVINVPSVRCCDTAVWTGSEMIVWGGNGLGGLLNTGARYNPSTDSWTATSTANAPEAREGHTAVWTGSEMIVWGAFSDPALNTGGRYNPSYDSWTATNLYGAPDGRYAHTAVWTGSEMIVWGGGHVGGVLNTGGRYNPSTNNWTATSTIDAPDARYYHIAVWTGSEMIVWGGGTPDGIYFNTGGRYNPSTNSWTATSITNTPPDREGATAVWTGGEMIVWGATNDSTGGRYNPSTDTWTATSTTNTPEGRFNHTAVWTDSQMIVWGGCPDASCSTVVNTGRRYNPATDSWTATTAAGAPSARAYHTAVWSGSQMIVWGGTNDGTGGRYCAQSAAPSPTPTATPTPTGRPSPSPRVRPTPAPRP